ncbi:MAG TPA: DUF3179 domain-containing (seleno)protein [Thermoanaerobaculia bacterium]|jgi:small-conductance mechanosensitive channel
MKGFALFLIVAAAVALVLLPAFILNPFAPETPQGLAVAHTAKRWAPIVTIVLFAVGLWLSRALWSRWWRKTLVVVAMLVLAATIWLSRQNHFEWMFNPLPNAAYASAPAASFVGDDEMVLAVAQNGEAAAYPIKQIAYHHIVHDVVGKVPIVVTY